MRNWLVIFTWKCDSRKEIECYGKEKDKMKRYYNMVTVMLTFLSGAIAEVWLVYVQIKDTEEWLMSTKLVMIHSKPVTFLVYGFLGGWFVSGLLAAVTIWMDWAVQLVKKRKVYGVIISIGGALIAGGLGFLPYAIMNTKQYGVRIFADRKKKNDLYGLKKDIAGTVFMICVTIILLVIIRRTWFKGFRTILGGALICAFVIFEGARKIHEINEQINRDCADENHTTLQDIFSSGKWDLMQSSMEGFTTEERLERTCEHISDYIQYYLAEKEWIGVTIEGGFFLEKHSDGTDNYLYILRAKDSEGYISEKNRKVWEYWVLFGDSSPENGCIEDLTEEWMRGFMDEFYEIMYDLYHKKNRKAAKDTGRILRNMKTYTC